jgi:RNA polymerase-associated protein CTR9
MYEAAVAAMEAEADVSNAKELERVRLANEARMREGDGDHDAEREVAVYKPAAIPYEVRANMAALLVRLRRVSEARKIFVDKLDKAVVAESLALSYNTARMAEMDGDFTAAEEGYNAVLAREPDYHEARLRLGCIAACRDKDYEKAEEEYKTVLATDSPLALVAAGFLNKLYITTKNPKAQQTLLETSRGQSDYMTVAFAQFMHSHLAGVGTADRRHRFLLNHIATPLLQVLKHSKRNVYAANGVGVFFAENGMMSEARDAFSAAGAGTDIARSARVNLAHVTIALAKAAVRARNEKATPGVRYTTNKVDSARGLCEQAEKLYSDAERLSAEQELQTRDVVMERMELLLYRANAKHEIGAYRQAADLLEQILHVVPESAPVWFNLGQVLRECAGERVLRSAKNLDEMLQAKTELESCRAAFAKAAHWDRGTICPVTRSRVDRKFLDHHTKFVAQILKSHEVSIINARNDAEDNEKKRLEKIEEVKLLNEKRELRAAQKRKEEEDHKSALAKAAAEARERFEKQQAERLERLKNPPPVSDDESVDGGGSGGEGSSKPRGKRRKRAKTPSEKPSKRRKSAKKAVSAAEHESSDEYDDEEVAVSGDADSEDAAVQSGGSRTKKVLKSAFDDALSDEDAVMDDGNGVRRGTRKTFALAPDSGSESDDDILEKLVS